METKRIVIDYAPRAAFLDYHATDKRYSVTVAHRRAGKTVARINKLIKEAVLCGKPNPRFGYIAPYYIQAKDIAWQYLQQYANPLGVKANQSELSITMPHNAAQIRLYGADNADRLRGLYFDGIVCDEAQDISPSALTQVIMPALSDRRGWLDLSGTPKGWGNLLGETYKRAKGDPEWFVSILKASETGLIDAEELARLRKMMPENEYLQEFECSFDAAITGAYYSKELEKAESEKRICGVPYDPTCRVNTAWDLGISDSMTIWFFQLVGREIRFIDYFEASGHGLDYYARELDKKGYLYGDHYAPHDIQVRELGTGKSRLEMASSLGIRFKPLPALPVADGISSVRSILPRSWFDVKKCAIGLDAIRQYREKRDEKRGIDMGPLHDWTSHAADALRYAAIGINERQPNNQQRRTRMTAESWMG